jgi:hypothetical protein
MTSIGTQTENDQVQLPRRKSYIGNTLLFLASIMMALAGAELVLRAFPQFQVQTGEGEFLFCSPNKTHHRPHPIFGYNEVPGSSHFERYSPVDPWYYVHTNDDGFRDNHDARGKPILVLGDSMTRGSLVNENETYVNLMDAWHPEWSFHNYGVGGYGQANSVRVYEAKSPELRHDLVIQQYSLGNDIDDNAERAKLKGDAVDITIRPAVGIATSSATPLVRIHRFFWNHSKVYPWVYSVVVRPYLNNWDARGNIDGAIEITRRLLAKLAKDAQSNNADLLLLVLPSWAEMAGRDDGMDPKRQRAMLEAFAAATPGVYLLDTTPVLAAEDPDQTYGIVDKHFTPYGQFLVAQALERWFMTKWPRGPKTAASPHTFKASEPVIPDCSNAAAYLELARTPPTQ